MIKKKMVLIVSVIIPLCAIIVATVIFYEVRIRNQHHWLPSYFLSFLLFENLGQSTNKIEHVMFSVADHHEHPLDRNEASISLRSWNAAFQDVVRGAKDAYGNP